uniref:Hydroxyisourate hydrolase isoform X2 n=1 Tax=Rhizophora mucronata TaxID=61149 RepID=A0A2P2LXW7_RHIMU
MLRFSSFLIILLCLAVAVTCADNYRRSDFPSGFIFGAGTSAYQVSSNSSIIHFVHDQEEQHICCV